MIEWTKILEEKYGGMHLIVATDKLESTRGVRQKLLAYEMFLNQNPELAKKVVMIQVAMSTTGDDLVSGDMFLLRSLGADSVTACNEIWIDVFPLLPLRWALWEMSLIPSTLRTLTLQYLTSSLASTHATVHWRTSPSSF